MNWEGWYHWKKRRLITIILFIIAYIVTIPIRDYGGFFDITQGITIWMHLTLIIVGIIVLLVLMKIIEVLVKKFILDKKRKKR